MFLVQRLHDHEGCHPGRIPGDGPKKEGQARQTGSGQDQSPGPGAGAQEGSRHSRHHKSEPCGGKVEGPLRQQDTGGKEQVRDREDGDAEPENSQSHKGHLPPASQKNPGQRHQHGKAQCDSQVRTLRRKEDAGVIIGRQVQGKEVKAQKVEPEGHCRQDPGLGADDLEDRCRHLPREATQGQIPEAEITRQDHGQEEEDGSFSTDPCPQGPGFLRFQLRGHELQEEEDTRKSHPDLLAGEGEEVKDPQAQEASGPRESSPMPPLPVEKAGQEEEEGGIELRPAHHIGHCLGMKGMDAEEDTSRQSRRERPQGQEKEEQRR